MVVAGECENFGELARKGLAMVISLELIPTYVEEALLTRDLGDPRVRTSLFSGPSLISEAFRLGWADEP